MNKKASYNTCLTDFLGFDIAVACPKCSQKAIIKNSHFSFQETNQAFKVTCSTCGFSKSKQCQEYIFSGPFDPFFLLPLWYQTTFGEHTIWAYNVEHLLFLENHVAAKLRSRNGLLPINSSLGSRLPKWRTAAKNRDSVIKSIKELYQK